MSTLRRLSPAFALFALASCGSSGAALATDAGIAADAPAPTDAPTADVPVDAGPATPTTRCAAITGSVQSARPCGR